MIAMLVARFMRNSPGMLLALRGSISLGTFLAFATYLASLVSPVRQLAAVLIVLGLVIKAVKWLIILGLIALAASIVMGVVKGRRTLR